MLGDAAGNVVGPDVHADRSAQSAVVLSMMACRMAGKFRTPEEEMGRSVAGKSHVPQLLSGGWDPSQHTLNVWRMLICESLWRSQVASLPPTSDRSWAESGLSSATLTTLSRRLEFSEADGRRNDDDRMRESVCSAI